MRTSKKLLSLFLSAVLCLSLLPTMAWAAENTVSTQETLNGAISSAQAGDTITIDTAGTYTLPEIKNNITIKGAESLKDENGVPTVVFNCTGSGSIASVPNGCTFENVTMNFGQNNYHGFQHAGTITMKDCNLNGLLFSYGDMNFTGCTFNQDKAEYLMWLYGMNVTFTKCTFNGYGKFFNVYNEGNGEYTITVDGCTANNLAENGNKAVFNSKETCGATILNNRVVLKGANTYTGAAPTGNVVLNSFVQVDDRTATKDGTNGVIVTVAEGTTLNGEALPVGVLYKTNLLTVDEEGKYHIADLAGLMELAAMANAGKLNNKTVKLDADIDLEGETWPMINGAGKNITFDGQSHTISNMVTPFEHDAGFFSTGTGCTIKDVNFDNATVVGIGRLGVVCGHGMCVAIENCKVTNSTVTAVVTKNDDGDKAGAICGYLSGESVAYVKNCTVDGCTITGYRDVGGAVGYAGGTFEVTNTAVKNTKVVNNQGNNYKNYTVDTQYDIGAVIGEATEDGTKKNNTATDVTVEVLKVAAIGDNKYVSLAEAFANVESGETITLLSDCSGNGIVVPSNSSFTVDFNNHTYTVNTDMLAGSNGTKNQCFQLLKGSTLTFKNGKIIADNTNIRMIIQNYADLTLEDMTLNATEGTNNVGYVLSNNCGKVNITGSTSITAASGKIAFDVCWAPNKGYPDGTQVVVNTTGTINGDVEFDLWGEDVETGNLSTLSIQNGVFTGKFKIDDDVSGDAKDNITISGGTFSTNPGDYVASGYAVTDNGNETYTVYRPSSGGGSSTTKTETTTNADGSKTTTTTDTKTGAVTETTTKTETAANGTKTETKVEVVTQKDGTVTEKQTETATAKNGTTATKVETTDAAGKTETKVEAKVTAAAVTEAKTADKPVTIPVTVESTKSAETAATVSVSVPKSAGSAKVEVPVTNVTAGTVAVLVKADGTEEIIKTSVLTEDGVALKVEGDVQIKIIDNTKEFTDVVDNHWAGDAIDFATSHEIFNGTGDKSFAPEATMTRAMLFTVLARFDDAPVVTTGENWYAGSMEWAKTNGVSDGTNPEGSISREQLATMLYRYAGAPAVTADLSAYGDAATVSDYAAAAMQWAVSVGLLNGIDGNLAPQGLATRAQLAAIMQRFCTNVAF